MYVLTRVLLKGYWACTGRTLGVLTSPAITFRRAMAHQYTTGIGTEGSGGAEETTKRGHGEPSAAAGAPPLPERDPPRSGSGGEGGGRHILSLRAGAGTFWEEGR